MERDLKYWENRLHKLEENIISEKNGELVKIELVNYVECVIHIALMREVGEYTYQLN